MPPARTLLAVTLFGGHTLLTVSLCWAVVVSPASADTQKQSAEHLERRVQELERELEVSRLKERVAELEARLRESDEALAQCRASRPGALPADKQQELQRVREEDRRRKEEAKRRQAARQREREARAERKAGAQGAAQDAAAQGKKQAPPPAQDAAAAGKNDAPGGPSRAAASKGGGKRKANPGGLSDELFCEGCKAVVDNMEKAHAKAQRMGDRRKAAASMAESLEKLCDVKNFPSYNFAPPKMIQACQAILSDYDDYLESLFTSAEDGRERRKHFCWEHTAACVGVDADYRPPPSVMIDGTPVAVNADGSVDPRHGPDGEEL
eukprot:TRINITY_DN2794_c1_g1_i1.p1 TRINITY_DN2794_c1_g1~~TRINITY_DN2794_c1_g1_i1.p1  ORF type:complete len:350 (+),score=147.71 TRINITY_DN2794_c1_g1_i1:81-1052(+)